MAYSRCVLRAKRGKDIYIYILKQNFVQLTNPKKRPNKRRSGKPMRAVAQRLSCLTSRTKEGERMRDTKKRKKGKGKERKERMRDKGVWKKEKKKKPSINFSTLYSVLTPVTPVNARVCKSRFLSLFPFRKFLRFRFNDCPDASDWTEDVRRSRDILFTVTNCVKRKKKMSYYVTGPP